MDDRETIFLVETLKPTLKNIQDEEKRSVAITKYLYNEANKEIIMPVMLWHILLSLNRELEEEKLNYQTYICQCYLANVCEECWTGEGLVFATVDNVFINITSKSKYKLECFGERGSSITSYRLCAVFLLGCLYKYNTKRECYVPKEFYKWGMFVYFLYSFDAFLACFKFCMENGNYSLDQVFGELLCLIFSLQGLESYEFMNQLHNYESEGAKFVECVLRNFAAMSDAGYEALHSRISIFVTAMKSKRREMIRLLKNNEVRASKIFGEKQMKDMLNNLEKDLFGELIAMM